MCGKDSGRVHLAGLIAARPGARTRLIYRMITCHGRRGEKKSFREHDFAALLDAARQQPGGPLVLVWDNATQHTDAPMRKLLAARSSWLTVFRLPACAPDLNPAEGVWSHLRRGLGNLAPHTTDQLATLARTRLKQMQYRSSLLDGFIAETGLVPRPP